MLDFVFIHKKNRMWQRRITREISCKFQCYFFNIFICFHLDFSSPPM